MSRVTASIEIDAPPERVWETVMDPRSLERWVTIHRRLLYADKGPPAVGFEMEQAIHLRGVTIDVHWQLVECEPPRRAVWEGRGPAHSSAHTEYLLSGNGEGTRFDYQNEFRAPLGPVGALVSRALVGGIPQREATRTLQALKARIENGS
jgi:carbon monoxide dehydrogenase subunit G